MWVYFSYFLKIFVLVAVYCIFPCIQGFFEMHCRLITRDDCWSGRKSQKCSGFCSTLLLLPRIPIQAWPQSFLLGARLLDLTPKEEYKAVTYSFWKINFQDALLIPFRASTYIFSKSPGRLSYLETVPAS